jgi:hypothetical protein
MNVLIYSNCHGGILKEMFEKNDYTKNKFVINFFYNYENLDKKMELLHKNLLENCDIFMYQPFNKQHSYSEYDISQVKKYLKPDCVILKINYYRFKGFWFESEYKPYHSYGEYTFAPDIKYFGIHNSFINFNGNKKETMEKLNDIRIDEERYINYFIEEVEHFKKIDDNSDVKMYDYFIKNYKTRHFFNDGFHPTNLFFYEMFRQIVFKLTGHELVFEDNEFIESLSYIEETHWTLPILPQIKRILKMTTSDNINVFYGKLKKNMSVYDYYYIRLSQNNFREYLENCG